MKIDGVLRFSTNEQGQPQWLLVTDDGQERAISGKLRKKAIAEHGVSSSHDGSRVRFSAKKQGPLVRLEGLDEILALSDAAVEEAEARKRKEEALHEAAAAAAARAARNQAVEAARERRTPSDPEKVARTYRRESEATGQPDVNPYTFLPFLKPTSSGVEAPSPARHRTQPTSSESPRDQLWSGRLVLGLDVATPVAVFGSEDMVAVNAAVKSAGVVPDSSGNREHRVVSLRRDAAGNPVIPGASLKGAARTWLEVITRSHRRIGPQHVAWRSSGITKARRVGVLRLVRGEQPCTGDRRLAAGDGKLRLDGNHLNEEAAANPDRWLTGWSGTITPLRTWDHGVGPAPQGDTARLRRIREKVQGAWSPNRLADGESVKTADGVQGRLKVGMSPQKVVSVQVALTEERAGPDICLGDEDVHRWIAGHVDGGKPSSGSTKVDGTPVVPPVAGDLGDGDLVWFQQDDDGRLVYFGRLRNGRWAELDATAGRVPGLRRRSMDALGPAERMLGDVDDGIELAGKVRFGPAVWASERRATTAEYTLVTLSSPKPSSSGFYLDGPRDEVAWTDPPGDRADATTLAGTKVYWHAVPADGFANDSRVRQSPWLKSGERARTKHNSTVEAVTDGSFETTITFEDLTVDEVGALLLACTLRFRGAAEIDSGWKIGMGKPVGLGSLRNRIVALERWLAGASPIEGRFEPVGEAEVDTMIATALDTWLPKDGERRTLAAVAEHHSLVERQIGYPPFGKLKRMAEGSMHRQPSAYEVAHQDKRMKL